MATKSSQVSSSAATSYIERLIEAWKPIKSESAAAPALPWPRVDDATTSVSCTGVIDLVSEDEEEDMAPPIVTVATAKKEKKEKKRRLSHSAPLRDLDEEEEDQPARKIGRAHV